MHKAPQYPEEMLRTEALKNGAGHSIGRQIGRTDLARQVGETNKALRCALPTRPGAAGGPLPPPETLHCSAFSDRSLGTRPPPLRVAGSPPLGTEEAAPVTGSQALPEALAATVPPRSRVTCFRVPESPRPRARTHPRDMGRPGLGPGRVAQWERHLHAPHPRLSLPLPSSRPMKTEAASITRGKTVVREAVDIARGGSIARHHLPRARV